MSYSDELDYQYVGLDSEDTKKVVIEHTTDKWETAKSLTKKLSYLLAIALVIYVFWLIWGVYYWIAFFASIPFTFLVAKRLVKIPIRWFMQIDVKQPKFNIFGIPKTWSWSGTSLAASDNADNAISLVHKIKMTAHNRKVVTEMSTGDFDRLEFLNDAKTLDRVVEDKEKLTAHLHYLKRNFWNAVISTVMDMQTQSVAKPINELLRKSAINLDLPTVGKRHNTSTEQIEDDE
jgi:hypothetical protein